MVELRPTVSFVRELQHARRPEPGVLCWNCRRLTPYEEDRCQSCGAAFGGSTGGAYATARGAQTSGSRESSGSPPKMRSLTDLIRDLGRVHDVSQRTAGTRAVEERPPTLFQCPSCGRFVGEHATSCACGVRFSETSGTFACPECDALVPVLDDACPVCGVHFDEDAPHMSYACPRCGTPVSADALRCTCGVWFED
ncbi:MAG TPA: hypothetical protein VJ326_03650 [Thermoplasmata archaeon]|nr:hypothetical protein [Thermoplasmata archaeon]